MVAGMQRFVWVSAEDAGEVAAINPVKGEVAFRIKVGPRPRGLRLSPDGKRLYVTLTAAGKPAGGGAGVAVVDVAARTLLRVLPAGGDPIALDLSPDGHTAYVANAATAQVAVLDLRAGAVVKTIAVGQEPAGVAVRPDGRIVYVATAGSNEIYAIDTARRELVMRVNAGNRPRSVVFSHDGATAFAMDEQFSEIALIDSRKHALTGRLSLSGQAPAQTQTQTPADVRTVFAPQPFAGALSPDGKRLYVSGGLGRSVYVVDVSSRKVIRAIDQVGQAPRGIGVGRDGKTLFTANGPSNDVAILDAAAGTVVKRVAVAGAPWGLVVGPGL
jgi:YVTN family beta-propeller protein